MNGLTVAERLYRMERLLTGDVEVLDTTTDVVTFLAGTTFVRTVHPWYVEECERGDVSQDKCASPHAAFGDEVRVGSLTVGATFARWDGEGDAAGWWCFQVVATARNAEVT